MDIAELKQFCTLFHASHYVPIFLYREEDIPEFSCTAINDLVPAHYVKKNLSGEKSPSCFYSAETGMWGRIRIPDAACFLILGPVYAGDITSEMLYAFMNWHGFPAGRYNEIADYLNSIPKYTYYRFLNMLAFLQFALTGEVIDIVDHFDRQRNFYDKKISVAQTEKSVNAMEDVRQHGTYALEQQLVELVRLGDVNRMRKFLSLVAKTEPLKEGKLAENPIRQAKNIFIGAATIFGKYGAIPGGLGIEETYQLIDTYVQECERLSSVDAITTLQYNMLIDFTSRVAESKIPEGLSSDVYAAMQFISNHTNEPLDINAVAAHIGRSRAWLTEKFRKETGQTVNDYILSKRLAESKSLLKHTDKSLAEIASFLCFSSQSYYQTLFRRRYGETPGSYRKRYKSND